jgi:teichuronic acid biosynthesis glycosyltransferase TuaH
VAGAELMRIDVRRIMGEERIQLGNADIAVVISPQLGERWKSLGFDRPISVIPNGVDTAAYRDLDAVSPAPGVELPFPVAGVVGQLSARIDIQLLEEVVDVGCSLLMVGPRDRTWESERFARLCTRANVVWVDRVPFDELPPYLKRIDVGLTPYLDTPFNRASFPLKTLEYLAAGKPVVSTDLPSAHSLATDLVTVADRCHFGRAVSKAALTSASSDLVARRISFAERHSWPRRAAEFAAVIGLQ